MPFSTLLVVIIHVHDLIAVQKKHICHIVATTRHSTGGLSIFDELIFTHADELLHLVTIDPFLVFTRR